MTVLDYTLVHISLYVQGRVLTLCWCTEMLHGYEVHFHQYRHINGWIFATDLCAQIKKRWCFWKTLSEKNDSVWAKIPWCFCFVLFCFILFVFLFCLVFVFCFVLFFFGESAWHIPVQLEMENPLTCFEPGFEHALCIAICSLQYRCWKCKTIRVLWTTILMRQRLMVRGNIHVQSNILSYRYNLKQSCKKERSWYICSEVTSSSANICHSRNKIYK